MWIFDLSSPMGKSSVTKEIISTLAKRETRLLLL